MGLAVKAFSKAVFVHEDDACEAEEHKWIFSLPDFVGRLDGKEVGCYVSEGRTARFVAGSYSGYNEWRRHLSLLSLDVDPEVVWENFEQYAGRPFVELIHMADNEGAIGPVTSRKLAADFQLLRGSIRQKLAEYLKRSHGKDDPWWLEKYDAWQKAFELASDGGFVVFE